MRKLSQIFLLLTIFLMAGSIFTSKSFSMENEEGALNVVALGDSITYGWNLEQDRSKPSVKAFPYLISENAAVTNISYPGWTSTQLLDHMKTLPHVIPSLQEADVVTLNIGSNDLLQAAGIQKILAGGVPVAPTPEMEQKIAAASAQLAVNLQEILTMIKSQTDVPIILYNVYNPFGPSAEPFPASLHLLGEQITKNVNEQVINPIAYHSGALVADANSAFSGQQNQYIIPGDIHPNETGHIVLAGIASEILASLQPDPQPESGWLFNGGNWYYIEKGNKVKGFYQMPDGLTYYFDKTGAMQTSWVYDRGQWYFFDNKSGVMVTGWKQYKNKWYYLNKMDGSMETGWLLENGKWYYLDPKSGAKKNGWVQDKNKWYYLELKSGAMETGWIQDRYGKWYLLNQRTGAMETGWVKDKNKWYYLDLKSGAMKTGWLLDNNKWYFLDFRSGSMKTGWHKVYAKWYYFYGSGSMASNTKIDGYKVGRDGAWIK
ncbi:MULTISPECIES: GDSL-type esterase/lipase family protein [Mesobacillus]|uniref:SGNH hydrolase-type esterase domain-containing protein n=1 Tax=Mesobacillus selenatarsenatis TaxID=388741 RepID=A0A846TR87_9BACI|nr:MULTISPECIES: GDSL-type esterase/lipase family protein [Mesobacillus]NKE08212.1 hypothetical protein [Mesobacillus selenatarsenatis]